MPSFDPSNDSRIIVQKGLSKKNNVDFSYYERETFHKNVHNATYFLFDLGMKSGMENHRYIFYPEDRMIINYGTNNYYNEAFKEIVNFNRD